MTACGEGQGRVQTVSDQKDSGQGQTVGALAQNGGSKRSPRRECQVPVTEKGGWGRLCACNSPSWGSATWHNVTGQQLRILSPRNQSK